MHVQVLFGQQLHELGALRLQLMQPRPSSCLADCLQLLSAKSIGDRAGALRAELSIDW